MTGKYKVLGLMLFAAAVVPALTMPGASANPVGGHFTNDAPEGRVRLQISEGGMHGTHLVVFGTTISCMKNTYAGETQQATQTEVTVTAEYSQCATAGGSEVTVVMHGCDYVFTFRNENATTLDSQVHFVCPGSARATIVQHGACTTSFGSQTITNAATYTTDVANGKTALTVDLTATNITYMKHGACVFLAPFGTGPHTGASLAGSVTVAGADTSGNPVNIKATGTNNH